MRSSEARRVAVMAKMMVWRTLANGRSFIDGIRYARSLQPPQRRESIAAPEPPGRLAEYFDQHTEGPGLWKWRHYFPIYERHLRKFAGREVHVLEVGIYSGGSLGMWLDYFGDRAHVYGIDIEPACESYATERVSVFIGDQADPTFWKRLLRTIPRVDVLIDDGGHMAHQQIETLKATLPALSPGGVYLCEDSHGPAHAFHGFVDGLSRDLHAVGGHAGREPSPLQQHVESVHRYPLLTVIEKPLLPVARFEAPKHGTQWQPFLG